jgi:hypothetical protein
MESCLDLGVKLEAEMTRESNPEFAAFDHTMGKLLSVSHEELQRRMEAYKKRAAKNPRKRGPKPKIGKNKGMV